MTRGRSFGIGCSSRGNWTTCQLCGKYGHDVADWWHRFDETFTPTWSQSNLSKFQSATTKKHEASTLNVEAIFMMAITHEYSLFAELEKQALFVDSGSSHHLIPHAHFFTCQETLCKSK